MTAPGGTGRTAGFAVELRQELLAAAERQIARRRRRHRLAGAVATASAVLVGALVLAVGPRSGSAGAQVLVHVHDGVVDVRLVDLEHRPGRITEAVREAGIDVTVRAVPVGPSKVGRFVEQDSRGPLPPELHRIGGATGTFRGFELPVGWTGSLQLLVGRPARPSEPYTVFSDATAAGEPLACDDVVGRSAAAVAAELVGRPLAVQFVATEGTRTVRLDAAAAAGGPYSGWLVAGADATSPRSVTVRLRPPTPVAAAPNPPAGSRCGR